MMPSAVVLVQFAAAVLLCVCAALISAFFPTTD